MKYKMFKISWSFFDYLCEEFQKTYQWTDDNWPDAQAEWIENMQDDMLIANFEEFLHKDWFIDKYIEEKFANFIRSLI